MDVCEEEGLVDMFYGKRETALILALMYQQCKHEDCKVVFSVTPGESRGLDKQG